MKYKSLFFATVILAGSGSVVAQDLSCSPEEIREMINKENKIRRTNTPTYAEVVQATTAAKIASGEDDDGCLTILDEGFDLGSITDGLKGLFDFEIPSISGMAGSYKKGIQDSFCTYFNPESFKKHVKRLAERGIKEYYGEDIRDIEGTLSEYGIKDLGDSFTEQAVNKQTRDGYRSIRETSTWEDPEDRTGRSVSRDVKDAILNDPLKEAYDSTK